MSCYGLQFLKIYKAGKYSFWQYCYLIWFYGPVNKKTTGSPINDYVNFFFFLLSWNILLLLFTKQLWCWQYMYKFPLHVSLGSVCMEGGRSQYQEDPRGWDNFRWVYMQRFWSVWCPGKEPWYTEIHKKGSKSTNHKPWNFELVEVNCSFLRGTLRWLTAAKKCKGNLAFELQNLRVFEKRSNTYILAELSRNNNQLVITPKEMVGFYCRD